MIDWIPIEELKEHTGVLLCEENIYYGGYIFGERLGNKIYINFKGERIELPINLFTHFSEIEMPKS